MTLTLESAGRTLLSSLDPRFRVIARFDVVPYATVIATTSNDRSQ